MRLTPPPHQPKIITEVWRGLQLAMADVADRPLALLIAVSGGADSICLCECVAQLSATLPITASVAHFNHQLRGHDSDEDAEFVQAFATARGLPLQIGHGDVAAHAQRERVSIEVAARHLRYAFLAQTAQAYDAKHILLAHHADDQAETILLRLIRGTGIAGLQGMRLISPLPISTPQTQHLRLLRPLLRVSRADIEVFCNEHHLDYRHDSSNDDPHHLRNRVRHELMPLLCQFNPGIRTVLTNLAETAAEDSDIVAAATHIAYAQLQLPVDEASPQFNRLAWQQLSMGLQRATLREGVRQIKGDVIHLKFAAIEEARIVLNSSARHGEIALLSDVRLVISGDCFKFSQIPSKA